MGEGRGGGGGGKGKEGPKQVLIHSSIICTLNLREGIADVITFIISFDAS